MFWLSVFRANVGIGILEKKEIGIRAVRKLLVKLTPEVHVGQDVRPDEGLRAGRDERWAVPTQTWSLPGSSQSSWQNHARKKPEKRYARYCLITWTDLYKVTVQRPPLGHRLCGCFWQGVYIVVVHRYRVCQRFRLANRNNYFRVKVDHSFFWGSWCSIENWLELKTIGKLCLSRVRETLCSFMI